MCQVWVVVNGICASASRINTRSRDTGVGLEILFAVDVAKKRSEAGFPGARGEGSILNIAFYPGIFHM